MSSAGKNDHELLQADMLKNAALSASPDHDKLIPVRIDHKTTIYCKPGENAEKKRQAFLKRLAESEKTSKKTMNKKAIHYN